MAREVVAPTEGPVWAYYGRRAVQRKSTKDEPLHALPLDGLAALGGAMDTECGVIAAIPVGPWEPEDPRNCPKCARYVAGTMPMPPELVALEQLAEPPTVVVPLQLVLFDAA